MITHPIETIPTIWSEADEQFFRVVRDTFDAHYVFGAGVLLAANDVEERERAIASSQPSAAGQRHCSTAEPVAR